MNNTFNLKRFGLLFKKYSIEHGKTNLMSVFVLTGILVIILGFTALMDRRLANATQTAIFSVSLIATGCIYTSMIFIGLGDKKKAIAELTLPVSHFEKYLVALVYTFPIFLCIFICAFYSTASIIKAITPDTSGYGKDALINIFDPKQDAFGALIGFAVLHSLAFWGAIFFNRLHFIKTTFVLFIALIILTITNKAVLTVLIGGRFSSALPYGSIKFFDENNKLILIDAPAGYTYLAAAMLAVLILLFWVSAFFRLKEKEV